MLINRLLRTCLLGIVKLLLGAYGRFGNRPAPHKQTIYFANHTSHADTLAVLAALPPSVRAGVRPIAARDYWDTSALRRFIAIKVLNVVFVNRHRDSGTDPLDPVRAALASGASILIFPEGKRNTGSEMAPFKSGIYWLAAEFPHVDLVPVHLSNLQRAMPKGRALPLPFMCEVAFGMPMTRTPAENKADFLERARQSVLDLGG